MTGNLPLAGLCVLETSGEVAVRYCGRLFKSLGARVVRLGQTDDTRIGHGGEAGLAYGVWLDAGIERVATGTIPSDTFDLVIGGASGLASAEAHVAKHGGVLLALTWFDPGGPYGDWRATDETITSLSALAYTFGDEAGPPMLSQGHTPQIIAGLVAFNASVAALIAEPRPKRVDVNVLEATLCFTEISALAAGAIRFGVNRYVPTYPSSPYRTSDGWVGITCLTPAQWLSLCKLIGRPDMAADPRLFTSLERLVLHAEVDAVLNAAFLTRTTAEWVRLCDEGRIPVAPMERPGKLPTVAHWRERGAFAALDGTDVEAPTLPWRMTFDGDVVARRPHSAGEGPLAGLRVVDFSMGWAGPLCARTLADMGADVVKIESASHPDWWRGWEAGLDDAARESALNFIAMNRNKRGVDIDLTMPEGTAQAKALIARADVVVENYGAGVLAKLGLGQDVQRALNAGVVSLTMPAFGASGPLSGLRAYGSTVEQASGLPFVNGREEWPPAQQHVAFGDPIAGLYGASAVLAALYGRAQLGAARIDLAQVACLFQLGADSIIAEQVTGKPVVRSGHARPRLLVCAVVPTPGADSWLTVAVDEPVALDRLAAITGGRDEAALAVWAGDKDARFAARILQSEGIAAAPLLAPVDLANDEQHWQSGFWGVLERAWVGRHMMGGAPFKYDGKRPRLRSPAPVLGEHTDEVLKELGSGGR